MCFNRFYIILFRSFSIQLWSAFLTSEKTEKKMQALKCAYKSSACNATSHAIDWGCNKTIIFAACNAVAVCFDAVSRFCYFRPSKCLLLFKFSYCSPLSFDVFRSKNAKDICI